MAEIPDSGTADIGEILGMLKEHPDGGVVIPFAALEARVFLRYAGQELYHMTSVRVGIEPIEDDVPAERVMLRLAILDQADKMLMETAVAAFHEGMEEFLASLTSEASGE